MLRIVPMTATLIGHARCSTDTQDLAAQRAAFEALGVAPDRVYADHGFTGTSRKPRGYRRAVRSGIPGKAPRPAPRPAARVGNGLAGPAVRLSNSALRKAIRKATPLLHCRSFC